MVRDKRTLLFMFFIIEVTWADADYGDIVEKVHTVQLLAC